MHNCITLTPKGFLPNYIRVIHQESEEQRVIFIQVWSYNDNITSCICLAIVNKSNTFSYFFFCFARSGE